MKYSAQGLAAAIFAVSLGWTGQPARSETDSGCGQASVELGRHLSSSGALERWRRIHGVVEAAVEESGHAPQALVSRLFAEPLAIASMPIEAVALPPDATPLESALTGDSPLDRAIERMEQVRAQLGMALAGVTQEQADRLHRLLPALLDRTSSGSDLEELRHGPVLAEIRAAIDQPAMEKTAALLAGLAQSEVAEALAEHFRGAAAVATPSWLAAYASGEFVLAEQTAHGAIIVGGTGNNFYSGPAALIIDLGGDDIYTLPPGGPVRIIIDLAGDDSYASRADGSLAGAVMGASLIADHAGDDVYAGGRITQGAAVAGVGMLHDRAGNDRFFAGELAQGASLAGIGVLQDFAGDDVYSATKFAQGFGGAMGIGVLVDHGGSDAYQAGNKHPSSYALPGRFQAFSQGVGMGFRNDIAGGVGLLHDRVGNDRYVAGNFSQGTGYYLGAGLLLDGNGNDSYVGGRYTQGAAAHLGVGVLRDQAGDDVYRGSPAASQGSAWDLAVGLLVDCAGNDDYTTQEFGLGAAAQNAIGIFFDMRGQDGYSARSNAFGYGGPTDYHDHRDENGKNVGNLGMFIDAGAARRGYNGRTRVSSGALSNHEDPAKTGGKAQRQQPAGTGEEKFEHP